VRALLVANITEADAGFIGQSLRLRGYAFTEVLREHHEQWASEVDDLVDRADLVLSLGSNWSAYWPEVAASVEAEATLLRRAHDQGVPILGICFGAQMLAHALGGRVFVAPEPEMGWCSVQASDPQSLAGTVLAGEWMQWHGDTFEPPANSEILASSDRAVQAFRIAKCLALQFHPEATESVVSQWSAGQGQCELISAGVDPQDLLTQTRIKVVDAQERCDGLVSWFLADVAGRPTTHKSTY